MDQPYEEGQEHGSSLEVSAEGGSARRQPNGELWRPEDESYYGGNGDAASARTGGSGGRWHYPANFEDTIPAAGSKKIKKKKDKKDRFARTEDAYSLSEETSSKRRKSKKKKSRSSDVDDGASRRSEDTSEFPEDATGGLYGSRRDDPPAESRRTDDEEVFNHEF